MGGFAFLTLMKSFLTHLKMTASVARAKEKAEEVERKLEEQLERERDEEIEALQKIVQKREIFWEM